MEIFLKDLPHHNQLHISYFCTFNFLLRFFRIKLSLHTEILYNLGFLEMKRKVLHKAWCRIYDQVHISSLHTCLFMYMFSYKVNSIPDWQFLKTKSQESYLQISRLLQWVLSVFKCIKKRWTFVDYKMNCPLHSQNEWFKFWPSIGDSGEL